MRASFLLIRLFYFSFFVFAFLQKSFFVEPRVFLIPGSARAIYAFFLQRDLSKKKVSFSKCLSIGMSIPEDSILEEESDKREKDDFSGIDSLLEF